MGILGKHDIESENFGIEVKDREKSALHGFMEQAVRNCPEGKTPMVIVHLHGGNHEDNIVCMRLKDWRDWFGRF